MLACTAIISSHFDSSSGLINITLILRYFSIENHLFSKRAGNTKVDDQHCGVLLLQIKWKNLDFIVLGSQAEIIKFDTTSVVPLVFVLAFCMMFEHRSPQTFLSFYSYAPFICSGPLLFFK